MTSDLKAAQAYMARAVELAWQAMGRVSPNPPVGAVLVKDGRIVGEGSTQPPGDAHAEIVALEAAGRLATGAELYVTLEPCAHQGRTAPCTTAIIDAGVSRVHIAALDPNPITDKAGVAALENAGISVSMRDGTEDARLLIEAFAKYITTGIPYVVAKFAMSLDGKIATRAGDSRWISNETSRRFAHGLRSEVDAVMVGIGTALADNPQLTVRDVPASRKHGSQRRQPMRVVVDSTGKLPTDAAMLDEEGVTLLATGHSDNEAALSEAGADVLSLPGADGQVDLLALLKTLGEREITSVLVEGGGELLGSMFDAGLVDKVVAIVAPVIIAGTQAKGPIGGRGAQTLMDALRLERVKYVELDGDMVVVGYVPHG
jgi:diaminohydroxyphosphoribosylaminopyrimidine deaminase/5-amino-6-(5-phosphoribosylamino)uracil reductase